MEAHADTADLRLWKEAKTSTVDIELITWFFTDPSHITVTDCKGVKVFNVETRTFMELAIFDIMTTFWESLPAAQQHKLIGRVTIYHKLLRRSVTNDLITQLEAQRTPFILHSWLKRTLCLLGHDSAARRHLQGLHYPSCLLDYGMVSILNVI
jgi:hypothetical protein